MTKLILPIIVAGGSGTRLWPVSRDTMPKQFISLLDGNRSTFQETLSRVSGPDFHEPVVVTNEAFRFVVAEQMQSLGMKVGSYLGESNIVRTESIYAQT